MKNRLAEYVYRHPLTGPLLWVASLQYFVVQLVVAAAWPMDYSWKNNYISDLGNTECGMYSGLYTCSPLHPLMNASFIVFGFTILLGSILLLRFFEANRLSVRVAFYVMMLSGIGTIMVGIFPENTIGTLHTIGAFLGLVVGNMGVLMIGVFLRDIHPLMRWYSVLTGIVCLVAFVLFYTDTYLGIGRGGMERIVSYPFTIWMATFGAYVVVMQLKSR